MAGRGREQEPRKPEQNPLPIPEFVLQGSDFRLISVPLGKKIHASVSPQAVIYTTRVENLVVSDRAIARAEIRFVNAAQAYIQRASQLDAVRLRPGSEDISAELDADECQEDFGKALARLTRVRPEYSSQRIKDILKQVGRQTTDMGLSHMGYNTMETQKHVNFMEGMVDEFFELQQQREQEKRAS